MNSQRAIQMIFRMALRFGMQRMSRDGGQAGQRAQQAGRAMRLARMFGRR